MNDLRISDPKVAATTSMLGSEAMVEMLRLHGVEYIFGLCGDTSLPFYDALATMEHGMKHILTRDERSAAYMADAYARVTGKVGVCEGPSGGGATYILPGLVEANESSIPVLGITTDIAVSSRGRFTLTELDQQSLFRPLTKWNGTINRSVDIPKLVRSAFTHMTTGKPGAAHLCLPYDVQTGQVDISEVWADARLNEYPSRRMSADPHAVTEAANLLRGARRPIFVCGGGVVISRAEEELRQLAEALEAPVATTISGQGSISEQHHLSLGVVGSNGGTPQTRAVLDECDIVVFVGCRAGSVTTERWRHPDVNRAKIIHIDADPAVIGANYPTAVALAGDAKLVLAALLEHFASASGNGSELRQAIKKAKVEKFEAFRRLASSTDTPIKPEAVVAALQEVMPSDSIIVADPGTPCPYLSGYYEFEGCGRRFITNRAHGALGYSLSAAIGAHLGRPAVKTISVMGDGSFGFAVGELETVVRLKLPITFIVLANDVYGWIKAGQKAGFQERYFSVDFSHTEHAKVAAAYGLEAYRVEDPRKLKSVLKQAIGSDRPSFVEVIAQGLHEANAPVSEWVA